MRNLRLVSSLPPEPQPTDVELTWIAGRIEHRIVFGRPVSERPVDDQHRILSFAPGCVFGVVRWARNDFGTVFSRIEVLRAVRLGEAHTRIPFVRPGADILLRVSGWADVERVLRIIESVCAARIDPSDAAPDYWVHVSNRFAGGQRPRPYTRARHLAWLLRRRLSL